MKIKKFLIQNYRAIEELEITLKNSINPIIGVNEAGKTTVLKAILAFDKGRDSFNQGEHLNPQNKYFIKKTDNCAITATINLDSDEVSALVKAVGLKTDTPEFPIINAFSTDTEFKLIRLLKGNKREYKYENEDLSDVTNRKIAKFLENNLPFLLYFDDFTDRVPDTINFLDDYVETGKYSRSRNRDWEEIIEEIFRRADTEGIEGEDKPLQNFLKLKNKDNQEDVLSDIEGCLNQNIIEEWKRIKKHGLTNYADDSEKLELKISFTEPSTFSFKVKDSSNADKRRTFDVAERSKGFQWFFNYMMKLKFNPRYNKKKQENSIFLLDEPGSYLHSSAQEELLNELASVSKENTIIFCTHSQYLLNPNVIKLGGIKIAEKSDSKIKLYDYGSYKVKKDRGALSPVYQALQLNFAHNFVGKVVITEGIIDFYFFDMLQKHTKLIPADIKFIPSSGAGNSSTLISMAIPFTESFLLFFDNDSGGKDGKKKYIREFGRSIEQFFHTYCEDKTKFVLEDFFSQGDVDKLLKLTKANDVKKAIPMLYYDSKSKKDKFFKDLSKDTIANLKKTISALKKM